MRPRFVFIGLAHAGAPLLPLLLAPGQAGVADPLPRGGAPAKQMLGRAAAAKTHAARFLPLGEWGVSAESFASLSAVGGEKESDADRCSVAHRHS